MNVEIGADAALFPEKEYINGIAVAVRPDSSTGYQCFQHLGMVVVAITQTSNLLVTLNSSGNERTHFWPIWFLKCDYFTQAKLPSFFPITNWGTTNLGAGGMLEVNHERLGILWHRTTCFKETFPRDISALFGLHGLIYRNIWDYVPSSLLISSQGQNFVTPAANFCGHLPSLF